MRRRTLRTKVKGTRKEKDSIEERVEVNLVAPKVVDRSLPLLGPLRSAQQQPHHANVPAEALSS
jgi:hypothetical protein